MDAPDALTKREPIPRKIRPGLKSTTELARELNRQSITTKAWTTADGKFRSGRPITKQYLYKMLRNPLYIGVIRHKAKIILARTHRFWIRPCGIRRRPSWPRMPGYGRHTQ